jgi:hypothetical protein
MTAPVDLPRWCRELVELYESGAASQFILYGNVEDRFVLSDAPDVRLGSLTDFLRDTLLGAFDIVIGYDVGNGIRTDKGSDLFAEWPFLKETPQLPRQPRAAVEALTHYFRYCANWARAGGPRRRIACVLRATHLIAPSQQGGFNADTNALALLVRDWSTETLLTEYPLATFLETGTLNDLHPLLARNPRAAAIEVPLPSADDYGKMLMALNPLYPKALGAVQPKLQPAAAQLAGASLSSVERLLRTLEHHKLALTSADLVALKKRSVELESEGLIEFLQPERTLDDLHGQEALKKWLRQDLALWSAGDVDAIPKGYLLCGPVGTGKTFMVECLAGEAAVPIVKLKNFRDMWVGSTEGNLEKIFRLVHALGKCMVFVDEADQALGRRQASSGDSGTSGRVYGMIAEEMGSSRNRGRIVWVLASSRPDLIEVDLKRPGRIDVKIPILPTSSAEEGFELLRALCRRRRVLIEPGAFEDLRAIIPDRLTPGAAEALAVKAYRLVRTETLPPLEAVRRCLGDYRPTIPPKVMELQIQLALDEASDASFIPPSMRVNAST